MPPNLQKAVDFSRAVIRYFKQNPVLYALIFLNIVGLLLFSLGRDYRHALFLGEIALITFTVIFFFIRGAVLEELERHVIDMDAHPGGMEQLAQDMARLGNAVVQINQTIGQMEQVKEFIADFESYKKGLSAIRQDTAGVASLREDVWKLTEELERLKSSGGSAEAGSVGEQYDSLKKSIQDAAEGREALSKAIISLKADVQEMQSQAEVAKALGGTSVEPSGGAPSKAMTEMQSKLEEIEKKLSGMAAAEPADAGAAAEKLEEWTKAGEELESKLAAVQDEFAKLDKRLKKLDAVAKAAAGESADAQLIEDVEGLKAEVSEIATSTENEIKDLAEELRKEIGSLKSQVEGLSEVGDITEAITTLRDEVADLRGKVKSGGGRKAPSGKGAAVDDDMRAELDELRKTVEEFKASQPHLEVQVKEAKLTPQQDRTIVQCSLLVKNLSNRPNEIVAVRAELDSGRDRMTPTSVRHWLPEGQEASSERRVFLPMTVLENSTTDLVDLTVAGWPLERTQDKYAFRITVRDKAGNEFVKALDLKPDKKKKA